jgi:hypothetical protein
MEVMQKRVLHHPKAKMQIHCHGHNPQACVAGTTYKLLTNDKNFINNKEVAHKRSKFHK